MKVNTALKRECVSRLKKGQVLSRYPFKNSGLFTIIRVYPEQSKIVLRCHSSGATVCHDYPFKCYKRNGNTELSSDYQVQRRQRRKASKHNQRVDIHSIYEP